MSINPRDNSEIFNLYANDKPDKTGITLQNIGKLSFKFSLVAAVVLKTVQHSIKSDSPLFNIAIAIFGLSFIVGFLMFIATGIHYSGRANGNTSFLSSTAQVLKKTFLYFLLPVLIFSILLIVIAYFIKRPT